MSVFLRWGVFGILAVAALLYAYNASKRLAARHTPPPAQAQPQAQTQPDTASAAPRMTSTKFAASRNEELPGRCRVELEVAYLAVMARQDGDPLDRLLRIQKIAWEPDEKVRERLTVVATRWYGQEGTADLERLYDGALSACQAFTPQ